jgi:hypothetical protein
MAPPGAELGGPVVLAKQQLRQLGDIRRDPPCLKENTPECSDEHQAMKSAPQVSSSESRYAADRLQRAGGDLG